MRVKVRFFGPLRDVAGGGEESVELQEGGGTGALTAALVLRHPGLDEYVGDLKIAVNQRIANGEVALKEGDEVALLPPVSGG